MGENVFGELISLGFIRGSGRFLSFGVFVLLMIPFLKG